MERTKNNSKNQKFPVHRVRMDQDKKVRKIGDGNFKAGIDKLLGLWELINRDPFIVLQKELENFSSIIKAFATDNHYQHYIDSQLPAMLHRFIKTGNVDIDFLKKVRNEKKIDEFGDRDDDKKPINSK